MESRNLNGSNGHGLGQQLDSARRKLRKLMRNPRAFVEDSQRIWKLRVYARHPTTLMRQGDRRKMRKLMDDPRAFFADSRFPALRPLQRLFR